MFKPAKPAKPGGTRGVFGVATSMAAKAVKRPAPAPAQKGAPALMQKRGRGTGR